VADHCRRATRVAIPLYLIKSSVSLHFLESIIQANARTHPSADVNGVAQSVAQPLEVIAIAERIKIRHVEFRV
jgi:hypothetical protein